MRDQQKPLLPPGKDVQSPSINLKSARKKRSPLPIMVALVISFSLAIIWSSYHFQIIKRVEDALILSISPILQALWAAWVMRRGKQKYFVKDRILQSMPVVWLPLIVLLPQAIIFTIKRDVVFEMVREFPFQRAFIALQAMRFLAFGSLLKWYWGIFPHAFAWGTAFPDFLFGSSALYLLYVGPANVDETILRTWNLIGFLIIVPFGLLILQLGMPPTQVYKSLKAPNYLIFEYPMVLAPAIVVPCLIFWNLIAVGASSLAS